MALRSTSALKLVAGAGALGAAMGIALAFHRSNAAEQQFAAVLDEAGRALPTADFVAQQSTNPMAPDPEALDGIPPFPNASPKRLSKNLTGQGSRIAMAWFETPQPVEAVLSFYEEAFGRRRYIYSIHRYSARSGYVSYFEDPKNYATSRLRLVSAVREGETTIVMLSNLRPLEILRQAALPAGLWLPVRAHPPQLFELGEVGSTRYTAITLVPDSTLASLEATFTENLGRQGWVFDDRASTNSRLTLDAKRGKSSQTISLTQELQGVRVLINLDDRELKTEAVQ